MKARALIDNGVYGPDTLKVIAQAFDGAWESIAGNFGDDPLETEPARLKLAKAIMAAANEYSQDVEALKRAALQAMARDYRSRVTGQRIRSTQAPR